MRSLLFVPADQPRKIEKALGCEADALILDLEDGVAPERRAKARVTAAEALERARATRARPRMIVRVNPVSGDSWRADLAAVMGADPSAIMLPKAASGADVARLADEMGVRERDLGLAEGVTRIIAIASEMPAALLAMASFTGCSPRLDGLAWGREDLSAALGAASTADATGRMTSPFRLARDLTLFAAAAAGVRAIDEIEADIGDVARLAANAREAARDGFAGKMAIHPDQVPIINAAFTPAPAEVEEARAIVALFAQSPGAGALRFGNRMVDRPHLLRAERILGRAGLAGR